MKPITRIFIFTWLCFFAFASHAIDITDDAGIKHHFEKPLTRIISLSPHITELLYDAGASTQIVATVSFSDYPPQAKALPRIGDFNKFDAERILALNPQLVIAWQSGNPAPQVEMLKSLGLEIFYNEPRQLEDVATSLETFGELLGTQAVAHQQASDYLDKLRALREAHRKQSALRVFYEVWNRPLMTVNGDHIINQVIELCGGENIFKSLAVLSPQVDMESVIAADPQVIVMGMNQQRAGWLQQWQPWSDLSAVKYHNLYGIEADYISRHTPRLLQGISSMCRYLDEARQKLPVD